MDTLVISIQSKSNDATKSVGKLISSLKHLRKELDAIGSSPNSVFNLNVGTKTSGNHRSSHTSTPNTKQLSLDEQLKQYNLSMDKLKPVSETMYPNKTISKFKTNFGDLVTITEKNINGMKTYNVVLKHTGPNMNSLSAKLDKMQRSMGLAQIKITALVSSFVLLSKKMVDNVMQAGESEEALNLFTVSMGEYAKEGLKWTDKFSKALYLDPVSVQKYMGSFNSLIEGLGVGSKNSYTMSKNLTQLVYDLSSFKNISITSAYEKLMSGISGELEPLRNIGVAMSEATLQNTAYSLGINTLVRNMTEAEKAQLRYVQIMKSSTEWQTDMGRTLITPTNALRVMQQQFKQLARAIGKVFIPVVMQMMPYIIAMTQVLTAFAEKLASLLGYKIADIDYSGLGEIAGGITDIGDAAEGTAGKLNTMLAPFDELNVVQRKSEGHGSGIGGIGGDLGIPLPEYDALANLNKKFSENVENAKKKLNEIIPILMTIGGIMLGWKIASNVTNFFKSWNEIGLSPAKTIGLTLAVASISMILLGTSKLKNENTFWQGVGLKLGGTIGIGAGTYMLTKNIGVALYVTGISLLLQGIKDSKNSDTTWLGIGESLGGTLGLAGGTFVLTKSVALSLVVGSVSIWMAAGAEIKKLIDMKPTFDELADAFNELFGGLIYDTVDTIFDAKDKVVKWFEETSEKVNTFWQDTKQGFGDFKDDVKNKFDDMKSSVSETWNTTWDDIKTKFNEDKETLSDSFTTLKTNLTSTWDETWTSINETMSTKWDTAKTWFSDHFGTREEWKEKFNSILDGASDILNELSNKFSNWTAYIKTPHLRWSYDNAFQARGVMKKALEALDLPTAIPRLNVDWYENGGFPQSGELYFANENGMSEYIGRMGNRAAVANNDQIVEGITRGVSEGMSKYGANNKNNYTTIYIGDKKVYEGYGDYVADENDRYGTNMIRI